MLTIKGILQSVDDNPTKSRCLHWHLSFFKLTGEQSTRLTLSVRLVFESTIFQVQFHGKGMIMMMMKVKILVVIISKKMVLFVSLMGLVAPL